MNNAIVRVNGQDLNLTGAVSYNTTKYDLEKLSGGEYATSTDPALPIYTYRIILTNVNDDAFDEDGCLTVYDTYNPEYLVYRPTYQTTESYNVNTPNGHVYGNNQWNKYGLTDRGPYVAEETETAGQLVFRLRKDDLPKAGASYYPYYTIAYALQIRDAETLARMKNEALHADGLKVELGNTAWNDRFGTSTVVTDYTLEALVKKYEGEEDNSATGTHDIHFSILVNPERLKIGDEAMITVRDTLSSLSFDYTSIRIEPRLDGDIMNRAGNSVIFTLHNETKYTITYTARLIGIYDVHWNNRAELHGYHSGVSGNSSSESGGSGSYRTYSMNVLKYAEGNMHQGLEATFELREARVKDAAGNDIPNPVWSKVGEFTTDGSTGLYEIRTVIRAGSTEEQSLRPYSFHDSEGHERFGTEGTETYGWRYRIVETAAPDGYQRINEAYEFGISDIPSYTAPYNYLNNDTVTIINKPMDLHAEAEVSGRKVLRGKALEDQAFTFSLRPEESALAAWGAGYPGGFDGMLTARNDAEGHFSFPLSFSHDDYLNAVAKGFADEDGCAYLYYVVREEVPEEAVGRVLDGVTYDDAQFLVVVKLFVDENGLNAETAFYPYDGNTVPRPPQSFRAGM